MQVSLVIDVPEEYFQKLVQLRMEEEEEFIEDLNSFENVEFQKKYIQDYIENLTGWSVLGIEMDITKK